MPTSVRNRDVGAVVRLVKTGSVFCLLAAVFVVTGCGSTSGSTPTTTTPSSLAITNTSLPDGQVGTAYAATLAATGGTSPYSWSLTGGTLPTGLALNAGTGAITGTPTQAVSAAQLTFKASDSASSAQTQSVTLGLTILTSSSSNPLAITTTSLVAGQVGVAYSAALIAVGGTTPYTWSLTSGSLPNGLTLNVSAGSITGTPTATTNATPLTFSVTDASSPALSQSVNLTLTVAPSAQPPALVISTSSLPNGQVGTAYSGALSATGGTAPYAWSVTSGTLPAGLTLNASTGAITGTPTATADTAPLTFSVADSSSPAFSQSVNLTLTIAASTQTPALSIATTSLPGGQVGTAYSATLAATGGTTPYTWSLTNGTLPAGLLLNATSGAISGTPTATASATSLTFTVTDAGNPVQTKSVTLTLTIAAAPTLLSITTTSMPNGQVGVAYNVLLAATGGTAPYTWSVTGGALPAGLSLNASTGAITGTPTVAAGSSAITFSIADSGNSVQTRSVGLSVIVYAAGAITVTVSRQNVGVTVGQTLSINATTTDASGATWSATGSGCSGASCGAFSSTTSLTGVTVTYTPPATAGVYSVTASSITNNTINASASVGVTDLAAVTTYHNDLARSGTNTREFALTTTNVAAATFGKLFSCTVDEAVYAQPLWLSNVTIASATHNVVLVATQNDSVYAFDADSNTSPCTPLWRASLLDSAHGAASGEASVPAGPSGNLLGHGYGDITPEVGITGTPVIDPSTNTLYVVSKSMNAAGTSFFQRLHALDVSTGAEKFSGPANIAATFPGNGDGGANTTFSARYENQRCGLALVNGVVYIAWAGHEDTQPFYGWLAGYSASNLSQVSVFNADPNQPSSPIPGSAGEGGIWMSGGAPAADPSGDLYLMTGNGVFDPTTGDYGDSMLKLSANALTGNIVVGGSTNYFTPSDQENDYNYDVDFGAGGAAVLIDLPVNGTNPTKLVVGGGKDNALYILNRVTLGGYGDGNAWQRVIPTTGSGLFATGAFWNSAFYVAPRGGKLQAFTLDPSTAKFTQQSNTSSTVFGAPGATPSVSSMPDNSNGIVWALDQTLYCTPQSPGCGAAVLHAYDATNLSTELWNSSQTSGDAAGFAVKFTVPTVANGRVYVGTRGNNTGGADNSTSKPGELDVYGLLN